MSTLLFLSAASVFAQDSSADLYNQWHSALVKYAYLSEADWFNSEGTPADFAQAVQAINNAGFSMADFICAKVASENGDDPQLYQDLYLLMHVTGIDLLRGDRYERDYRESRKRNVEDFKRAWRSGIYSNVSSYIRQLCEELIAKNEDDNLNPLDLRPIRRYGLYGLPELIRQIRTNGSKHAFAVYLIMTGNSVEYAEFVKKPKLMYRSKEEKLAHIEKWLLTPKGQIANNSMGNGIEEALRTQ